MNHVDLQRAKCEQVGAPFFGMQTDAMVGIAKGVEVPGVVLNGLRHAPSMGTTGWYIWPGEGEPKSSPDFFAPVHAAHLSVLCPQIVSYLPPGWRFLVAADYEDTWFDPMIAIVQG